MRILIQNRPEALAVFGGEAVQMLETAKALEGLGHEVSVDTGTAPPMAGWDVVHLFNLTMCAGTYLQASNAHAAGKPIALSTIYFTWDEFERHGRFGVQRLFNRMVPSVDARERLKSLARMLKNPRELRPHLRQVWMGYRRQQIALLRMVDVLLPNSALELEAVRRDFPEVKVAGQVVPNAAVNEFRDATPDQFVSRYGLKDFVLCVARIDSRKNQLALIEALRDGDRPVVFIGGESPRHGAYFRAFLARLQGSRRFHYLGQLPPPLVASAYKAAAVHVLPSWIETPGLSSLEAALAGCRVVTTDRGSTREYFGDLAWYCDPRNPESIRQAVCAALGSPPRPELASMVEQRYNWERAARETVTGYQMAIQRRRERTEGLTQATGARHR